MVASSRAPSPGAPHTRSCPRADPGPLKKFRGRHSDVWLDANTFHIAFRGNGDTSRQTVETDALYRRVELPLAAGYDHFGIVSATRTLHFYYVAPETYSSTTTALAAAVRNMAFGSATTTCSSVQKVPAKDT